MPETNPFAEVDLSNVHANVHANVSSSRAENAYSLNAGETAATHAAAPNKPAEATSFEPLEIATEDPTGNCANWL
jgi:hypothetical protein